MDDQSYMPIEEKENNPFFYVQSQDLLENPCLLKQGKNQLMLCSRVQSNQPASSNELCLYNLKSFLTPKLATNFFPIKDTYTKIFISKMNNGYFGGYQIKSQGSYLTLFRMTGKGFKKLSTMKLNSYGINAGTNSLFFLETPYECLFIPGDGSIKYINLKKKAILDETAYCCFEGFKYHPLLKILAVKSKEELILLKLTSEKKIVSLNQRITGQESFQGGVTKPIVNFLITQYADLKDYVFDNENSFLYVVFAWVSWTNKSVVCSLPPTITHLRFQKWKFDNDKIILENQRDIEWNHSRTQTCHFHVKQKQCLVNGLNEVYIISLESYQIMEIISGKEFFAIADDNQVIMKEPNINSF